MGFVGNVAHPADLSTEQGAMHRYFIRPWGNRGPECEAPFPRRAPPDPSTPEAASRHQCGDRPRQARVRKMATTDGERVAVVLAPLSSSAPRRLGFDPIGGEPAHRLAPR